MVTVATVKSLHYYAEGEQRHHIGNKLFIESYQAQWEVMGAVFKV